MKKNIVGNPTEDENLEKKRTHTSEQNKLCRNQKSK